MKKEESLGKRIFGYIDVIIIFFLGTGILISTSSMLNDSFALANQFASPTLFPKIVAYLLMLLALIQFFIQFKRNRQSSKSELDQTKAEKGNIKPFLIGVGIFIVYILLIPILGFLIATVINIFCFIYYFGKPKWYQAAIYTIVCSVVIYLIFSKILNVPLPASIFLT